MESYRYKVCCLFSRTFSVAEVGTPEDVKEVFDHYAQGGILMNSDQFRQFLVEYQAVDTATTVTAEKIMEDVQTKYHHLAEFSHNCLSLDGFFHFLFSVDLNPPFHPQVHQDMTLPLSHYFIYTGHNSYLTGNQLTSDCSDIQIIKALRQGVRVIELDLWPNESKDNIIVDHGRTLTTPVDLRTCLRAIKNNAFDSSNIYPVIITLEDHLKPKLQVQAAEMIAETFGHLLFIPTTDSLKDLPSPEELKGKILISTKPSNVCLEAEKLGGNIDCDPQHKWEDTGEESSLLPSKTKKTNNLTVLSHHFLSGLFWFCTFGLHSDQKKRRNSQNFEPVAYNQLIAIQQRRKGKLKEALQIDPDKVCRVSLSEKGLKKAVTSHGRELVRFTQKNIVRIYPKGARVDSSNYNPFTGWMHGAQMVAFNMQGYGSSLWQMQGMFKANGGCGYVRKPDFLMNDNPVIDPKAKLQTKRTLKVKVYMGDGWRMDFKKTHFNSYSPPDFDVTVGIVGVPADKIEKYTDVSLNQWTPVWNQEFNFPLTVPELALLRIEVSNYNNGKKRDCGGQNCLPVPELRPGIYAIPLYSEKGERLNSVKLLLRFTFD